MEFGAALVPLFAIATAVAIAARRFKVPYTAALVVAGLVLGGAHLLHPPRLTKELLYTLFLPGLLFEAAFHLETRRFLRSKLLISLLAVPGVVAAIALTAALLTPAVAALALAEGFSYRYALVFGAIIAATDPIAVVALFKSLGAPRQLAVIVEGESLLNDGTAVVLFTIILSMVRGQGSSVVGAGVEFVTVVGVGAVIGAVFGFLAARIIRRIDEPMIEITLTMVAAYGSFVAAEHAHGSGVIATVVAGMICGNYAAAIGMSPSTRIAVASFWEYVAFALNSIVFLLIGFEIRIGALLASYAPILIAFAAVTVGRALVIALASAPLVRTRERLPLKWAVLLSWGGLRGGLSMVLVLGLDERFPFRELLITMTFGVVLLSILIQGLTMAPLLRVLGIADSADHRRAYELERGERRASVAALAALDGLITEGVLHSDLAEPLRREYQGRVERADERLGKIQLSDDEIRREQLRNARRLLLSVEKDAAQRDHRSGILGASALEALERDIDRRTMELEHPSAQPTKAYDAS